MGDLHGNAPDRSSVALLIIDAINDFEWPGGKQAFPAALRAARRIAALKTRLGRSRVPAIYVNDNFGRWKSDFTAQVQHCLHDGVRGRPIAELLVPSDKDYFVLKPKHSGFFETSLHLLLQHIGAARLIVTGYAANSCVLFTAHDAYLRDYQIVVPRDCVASNSPSLTRFALAQMQQVCKARITPSVKLRAR
jgi:nicotinamidase-related amidase